MPHFHEAIRKRPGERGFLQVVPRHHISRFYAVKLWLVLSFVLWDIRRLIVGSLVVAGRFCSLAGRVPFLSLWFLSRILAGRLGGVVLLVLRGINLAVPISLNKIDRLVACVVLSAVLLPVFPMVVRNIQKYGRHPGDRHPGRNDGIVVPDLGLVAAHGRNDAVITGIS